MNNYFCAQRWLPGLIRAVALPWVLPGLATLASIEPAAAQSSAIADSGGGLEEIVVTARRREERLQDTPIAVSAFTADSLERQQIFNTEDLGHVTPSL
jgi:iron complex outermembrane receptor protein